MDKIELLYDHYKETCEIQRTNLKIRNTAFVIVIIILGMLLLLSYSPDTIGAVILSILNHEYGIDAEIQFGLIQSLVCVVLLYSSMRYYQTTVYLERLYKYLHKVEDRLNTAISDENIIIDREGRSYLSGYPQFNDTIDFMYKWLFPILYIVAIAIKIYTEKRCSLAYALDVVLFIGSFVLCILYILFNAKVVSDYKITEKKHEAPIPADKSTSGEEANKTVT